MNLPKLRAKKSAFKRFCLATIIALGLANQIAAALVITHSFEEDGFRKDFVRGIIKGYKHSQFSIPSFMPAAERIYFVIALRMAMPSRSDSLTECTAEAAAISGEKQRLVPLSL